MGKLTNEDHSLLNKAFGKLLDDYKADRIKRYTAMNIALVSGRFLTPD
jgi:hypothetical protein